MRRKIEITLETAETVVLRKGETIQRRHCPACSTTVDMASPYVLSTMSGLSEREVFRLIECAAVHFVETDRLLICLNSLKSIKGELTQ